MKQTGLFSFQTTKQFSRIVSVALYLFKVLTDLFKMQAPETYSGFQGQFHIQNLNDLSSGQFPIQMIYFCQIITVGTHAESFVYCDLEIFSKSPFSRKQLFL